MGLLEQVNYKLTLICQALNIALDGTAEAAQAMGAASAKFEPVENVVIPGVAVTPQAVSAAVLGTSVPPAPAGVVRVTVKQALAAGAKLTGQELDEQGCYWAKDINTSVPAVTQKNIWKRGKGIEDAVYDGRVAAIKAEVAGAASAVTLAAVTNPALGLPLPGVPAVAGLPLPGASASLPVPGVHQSSLEDPIRKEIIAGINLLTNKYEIDYAVIGIMLSEHGAKDGTFIQLPDAGYPEVRTKLNAWAIAFDLVEEADLAVRGMNNNDPTYLMTLMNQLKLGTQDLTTVQYRDLYRLYQNVHAYQNTLEAHFGKPVTPIKPDPFAA